MGEKVQMLCWPILWLSRWEKLERETDCWHPSLILHAEVFPNHILLAVYQLLNGWYHSLPLMDLNKDQANFWPNLTIAYNSEECLKFGSDKKHNEAIAWVGLLSTCSHLHNTKSSPPKILQYFMQSCWPANICLWNSRKDVVPCEGELTSRKRIEP